MSEDAPDFFAPPAFKPEQALLQLRRWLRDQRVFSERGAACFLLKGQPVLELSSSADALTARLAKRPAQRPEWEARVCSSSADVRRLQDEIKKRLARWTDEE
jgi:hypothetical protein